MNIVGRGGPVLKDLWPRVYDPLCKISNTLKISLTYEVLSARLEAQIDIKAKKKKRKAQQAFVILRQVWRSRGLRTLAPSSDYSTPR